MRTEPSTAARRVTGVAAASLVVALTGVLAGDGSAVAGSVSKTFRYTCEVPSVGPQPVTVDLAGTFPPSGSVGRAITPTGFSLTAKFPKSTAQTLAAAGATSVLGGAEVAVTVFRGAASADVVSKLTVPATAVPANAGSSSPAPTSQTPTAPVPSATAGSDKTGSDKTGSDKTGSDKTGSDKTGSDKAQNTGGLALVASGDLTPITVTEPGEVLLSLRELTFTLTPRKADGETTDLDAMVTRCVLDADQDGRFAAIPVTGTPVPTPLPGTGQNPSQGGKPNPIVVPEAAAAPPAAAPTAGPPQTRALTPINFSVMATTTIKKLKSKLVAGPGIMHSLLDARAGDFTGDLTLPPAPGYFVMFDFVPQTAVTEFVPEGLTIGKIYRGTLNTTSKITLRLSEVKVAGVPLDVGPNCRTVEPAVIELTTGPSPPPFLPPLRLKPLYGTFTIPPFTGCGATEPLDSLVTGLISGPDNDLRIDLTHIPN